VLLFGKLSGEGKYEAHIGFVAPVGDYGLNIPAEAIYGGSGCAETGVLAGIRYFYPASNLKNFYYLLNLDVLYNNFSHEYKNYIKENSEQIIGGSYGYKFSSYVNIPLSFGAYYEYPINKDFKITADATLGLNCSQVTSLTVKYTKNAYIDELRVVYDPLFRFTQQGSVGILLNKKYTLRISYCNFGGLRYKSIAYESITDNGTSLYNNSTILNASNLLRTSTLNLIFGIVLTKEKKTVHNTAF